MTMLGRIEAAIKEYEKRNGERPETLLLSEKERVAAEQELAFPKGAHAQRLFGLPIVSHPEPLLGRN